MPISLQSDLKKRIRLSLIIDLANDSVGSSECRDSTIANVSLISVWRAQLHTIMISPCWPRRVGGVHWL